MLIPPDSRFPQIAQAFDPVRMRAAFQDALVASSNFGATILNCAIEETLYKPGKSCGLVYRLDWVEAPSGLLGRQLVCAKLCLSGESLELYTRARNTAMTVSGALPPVVHLGQLDMVAWTFPNDPVIRRLPDLLDPAFMAAVLPRTLPSLDLNGSNRLHQVRIEVLHYRSERTCMLRYDLDIENRATGHVRQVRIYGKCYGRESSTAVFNVMAQLAGQAPRLATAVPLGFDAELNAVWQSHLPGAAIELEQTTPAQFLDAVVPLAHCTAAFHCSAVTTAHLATIAQILSQLQKTVRIIGDIDSRWGERIARLVRRLNLRANEIDFTACPVTPIHRDLKLGNFLLHENRATLIDLDEVSLGDPLIDIGSFIAAFGARALLLGWDQQAVHLVVETFLRHYAARVPWPVVRERLDWYSAASFVFESIHRGVRQWDAEKLRSIPRWIAVAESYAYGPLASIRTAQPVSRYEPALSAEFRGFRP